MEKLTSQYEAVSNALERFHEDLVLLSDEDNPDHEKYYRQFRNSSVQTFQFTLDTFWKFLKQYIFIMHSASPEISSPRGVFRECMNLKILTEKEFVELSQIVADRNLTSHSYNEELAEKISDHLPKYYEIMQTIMNRIEKPD